MTPDQRPASDEFWTQIQSRLRESGDLVLLLERWARGAGMRSWYALSEVNDLDKARKRLRPGSSLTAYVNPNLPIRGVLSPQMETEAAKLMSTMREHGELIALSRGDHPPDLAVEYIADAAELDTWAQSARGKEVWIGEYPDWPEDGEAAINAVVPDSDGVVRPHPY